ncbi:hypothetical protein ACFPVS_03235 [Neisseria weixii]|uniref:Uncharacterized protein n=1 Tax=Neisseria weixii TaxID=1853276 RepID=A0A3N4N352_9NEIS|nr:hypothetical protein [Neisseria weixii]ATD65249.1 hypothetical protein CGZ65_07970 [Neisseria weixii]RPD89775.1 hypothetical protein EGK74_03045 [Neisseria weixii]RPD90004.1 hypothetical protein EGK75_03045 [Neisseria weixii]
MSRKTGHMIFYMLLILPTLIFLFIPAHAAADWAISLNSFLDDYLFGNGYYKPDRYPFASKVTNSFTVVSAVFSGIYCGIFSKYDPDSITGKDRKKMHVFFFVALSLLLWVSIYPQEFSTSIGRSFGTKQSFHNNYFYFLFLMTVKEVMIFLSISYFVRLFSKRFERIKNPRQ